ncbi:DNA polymerase III subunit delta [Tahibacter amnicola]|uniref:DNA polymerase III subunit delta n=1 Tax=Tahibacter amnicola TaxID=2976241 RepID=A0ABY6BIT4_9GAMM|nr:DNA polymerase III subunit delta [Tahibacter amnicola]UXI69919.1 DNA polymerase III subunit delta [Tahibacter amnicola]
MPLSLEQLRRHLGGSELKPVYFLAGEEHLLLIEAADALRARARELGYLERDILDAESGFDWDDLARAASGMSLFASRKVIDLRVPTGKPGKDGAAAITEYCERPPPDTVLLITATQWSKQHAAAWVDVVDAAGAFVPIWPLKTNELYDWISQRLASRGVRAQRDAIEVLVERVEGNLLAAAQEIDKLALLAGDTLLDADTLENLVADSARYDAFKLTDAALAGDAARALRILGGLRGEGEQVPALMGWVLNQLQLMVRLASAANPAQGFRAERIWPAREGLYRKALQRGSLVHWETCLAQAAKIDRISKGRGAGDAWVEFERLLAAMALPRSTALIRNIAI